MTQDRRLSDLQLAVMRVLWDKSEATVTEVHAVLHTERGLAPTTVATVLSRLEKRGFLRHRSEGRQFIYVPMISEEEVRSSMVGELTELLFEGKAAELVNHLLGSRELSPGDLARLRALIEAGESKKRGTADDAG